MTKELILIRHATSEEMGSGWVVRDFDRKLTSEGIMEAAKVGNFLKISKIIPQVIYSSDSPRAKDTAAYLAEQLGFPTENLKSKETLYGLGPRGYLKVVNDIPKDMDCAIVIGHNPDISYFADYLIGTSSRSIFNPATIYRISFEEIRWEEVSQNSGSLIERIDVKDIQ